MKHARPVGLLLLSALCWAGCTPSPDETTAAPPTGYPQAYAMRDCAPWDGPAIAILLTAHDLDSLDVGFPMVRLMIYPRDDLVAGSTYHWPADPEMGPGNRCLSENDCEAATSGEVTLTTVRPDTALEGLTHLTFAHGMEIVGGFRATWVKRQTRCG